MRKEFHGAHGGEHRGKTSSSSCSCHPRAPRDSRGDLDELHQFSVDNAADLARLTRCHFERLPQITDQILVIFDTARKSHRVWSDSCPIALCCIEIPRHHQLSGLNE